MESVSLVDHHKWMYSHKLPRTATTETPAVSFSFDLWHLLQYLHSMQPQRQSPHPEDPQHILPVCVAKITTEKKLEIITTKTVPAVLWLYYLAKPSLRSVFVAPFDRYFSRVLCSLLGLNLCDSSLYRDAWAWWDNPPCTLSSAISVYRHLKDGKADHESCTLGYTFVFLKAPFLIC